MSSGMENLVMFLPPLQLRHRQHQRQEIQTKVLKIRQKLVRNLAKLRKGSWILKRRLIYVKL